MPNKRIYTENELLKKIADGNEEAFRYLFHLYNNRLYCFALKITESKELAEDIVHDTFLKIWASRESLSLIQNFNAYIFRIAQNNIYNGFRRNAKKTLILAELERSHEQDFSTCDDVFLAKDIKQFIYSSINKLTPQQKRVFILSREEGLKNEEIAAQLNISVFTVKKHLTGALNTIKKEILENYPLYSTAILVIYPFFN